jgi:GT2 family glycosyltransferase
LNQVTVVLLNWNGRDFLAPCIEAVLSQTYSPIELIVVDNGSSDGSIEFIRKKYGEQLTIIENGVNLGFSRAMNIGMAAAAGKYIMPLNFDIIMNADFISRMVEAAETAEDIGSISGKLLRLSNEGKTDIIDSTGHLIFNNRYVINRGEDQKDTGRFDTPGFVFGTCGAVPLYKKDMLDDIAYEGQYYDEAFFIMLEDVDIDWRAQLRGWRCLYAPAAVAYHYRGATGSGKSRLIQRHYFKNRYLLMWQNDKFWSILKSLPAVWLMDMYLFIDIIFTSPPALFLAMTDLVRLAPLARQKRHFVQSRRKIPQSQIETWFHKYRWADDIKRKLGIGTK